MFCPYGGVYGNSTSAISGINGGGTTGDLYLEWVGNDVNTGKFLTFRNHATTMGSAFYTEWYFRNSVSKNSTNTSTWNIVSDQRVKDGNGTEHDTHQLGFIAQQVNKKYKNSVSRGSLKMKDKRNVPDMMTIDVSQINMTTFGAVKQLIRIVEKQSKRIKKLEEQLGIRRLKKKCI